MPMIKGLIAAPFTPMHKNGEINLEVIEKYVDILLEQGVRSVFVNGSTGEGWSLTLDERKKAAEKWITCGKGKLDYVIIHAGTNCLKDSQELARHAASSGAGAIASLSPCYYKPATITLLVDYLAEVASAAPKTPLYYYHIPSCTGVDFNMCNMMEEAIERIPSFAGIKYTSDYLQDFGRCVDKFSDRLNLCYGRDEQFVGALMLGAHAGVGSSYNYAGKIYSRMMAAFSNGDYKLAAIEQHNSQRMFEVMFKENFDVGVNKSMMEAITGLPVGPARLPIKSPSDETVKKIMDGLKSIGFFELIK